MKGYELDIFQVLETYYQAAFLKVVEFFFSKSLRVMAFNRLGSSLGILQFRSCQLRIPDGGRRGRAGFFRACSSLGKICFGAKKPRFFLIILQLSATKTDIIEHYSRFFSIRGFLYQQNSTSKSDSLIMHVCACTVCTCVPLAISIHLHPTSPIAYNWS